MLRRVGPMNKPIVFIAFFAFLLLVFGGWAFGQTPVYASAQESSQEAVHGASGGGTGSGEGHQAQEKSADLKDLLYRFINFALLVIILVWALKKAHVKDFFIARAKEIQQRLEDLKREKEEAERKYRDIEQRLRAFEEERKRILEQYRQDGEAEKEKIIAEAEDRVRQILEQAEMTIRQETESAKSRLKQDMVEIAAQKAEEIITERITDKDQDSLVNDFIERVGKIH